MPDCTAILRDLAKRYIEICSDPVQTERRSLWRRHNSLKRTRPLIYVRAFAWQEMPMARCVCADPLLRSVEDHFRRRLFWNTFGDDSIFEPWVTIPALKKCTGWGVSGKRQTSGERRGSFKIDYPIKRLEDIEKLRVPWHEVDEDATRERGERVRDVLGDLITIEVDRAPAYRTWSADLSTDLGYLRGIEHFMMDMLDHPAWLHRLVKFMSDGVLKTHEEAEIAGDWGLAAHQNQAMPYAEELRDPAPGVDGIRRKQLWIFVAAQEFTATHFR